MKQSPLFDLAARSGRRVGLLAFWAVACLASWLLLGQPAMAATAPLSANFSSETASEDVRKVADWVIASRDHGDLPFIIVDKAGAKLFLFDGGERLRGVSAVLLGVARGDDSPSGIGEKSLAAIKPEERITPAGRFVAALGHNLSGEDILWVDYEAALSLHRLTDPKPGLTAKGRAARLASASTLDNRVSHGCINVSGDFFDHLVRPIFGAAGGIVYILPETRPVVAAFPIQPAIGPAGPSQAIRIGDSLSPA